MALYLYIIYQILSLLYSDTQFYWLGIGNKNTQLTFIRICFREENDVKQLS